MLNKTLTPEHSKIVLSKMCEAVGASYATIDFSKHDWYHVFSWTIEQEQEYIKWLSEFLEKYKYTGKRTRRSGEREARHEAIKMVANYGWRVK